MRLTLIVWVSVTLAVGFAFRPELAGSWAFWAALGACYVSLGLFVAWTLWRRGRLRALVMVRAGDLTWGVLVAGALLVSSWAGRALLAPPGSEQYAWLLGLYLQLGDPDALQRSALLTLLLIGIAVLEELVWRGGVLEMLSERVGARRAWVATALAYALAHAPTLYTLRAPEAGLNPLLMIAALGCGLCWSFMTRMFQRLPPAMISHAVFTYFTATQFRIPGL
jgi:membrane protease YdiL (CAAX protease family)